MVAAQALATQLRLSDDSVSPSTPWNRSATVFELAQRIRSNAVHLIGIDDPVWGGCLSTEVVWKEELAQGLVEVWSEEHWQRFGIFCDAFFSKSSPQDSLLTNLICNATLEFLWTRYKKNTRFRNLLTNKNQDLPHWLFELLAKDKSASNRSSVASNPNCPLDLLAVLTKDKNSSARGEVASNPNCPLVLLEILAKDKDSAVRRNVASNPNCPLDLLAILAKDKDSGIHLDVASNPNCPEGIRNSLLAVLAKDEDAEVREMVGLNLNCPLNLLEILAKDKDKWVRESVTSNPKWNQK